jgi:hypothetical protein
MTALIPVTFLGNENPLAGLRLEQTSNGHIATPWFTFDWKGAGIHGPADIRSRYHVIIPRAIRAFADAIGESWAVDAQRIIVSQRADPKTMDQLFRLSTAFKKELPRPKKEVTKENAGAIDI